MSGVAGEENWSPATHAVQSAFDALRPGSMRRGHGLVKPNYPKKRESPESS
jgi:hypothetical protein